MTPSWVSAPNTKCRVCDAPLGAPYLDLGEQPLANALVPPVFKCGGVVKTPSGNVTLAAQEPELRFPLQVILCEQCGLSQLSVVVNPEILYSGYRFRSGASEGWVKHCEELAKRCTKEWEKFPPGRVLDIAANDGTQLKAFASRGWEVVGVDPAAPAMHPFIIADWWTQERADYLASRPFDLVIAQNVLGHVDDPIAFLKAVKTVLAEDGRCIVEVPYVGKMIESCAFDTVYHEHLSYWSLTALEYAAYLAGLELDDFERLDVHGGSYRCWLVHAPPDYKITLSGPAVTFPQYAAFAQRVADSTTHVAIAANVQPDVRLVGWGASAKATVMLNALWRRKSHCTRLPEAIIDETPEKQGLLLPGVHIPIVPPPDDLGDVDVLWCLSWNNFESIKRKALERGFQGQFLLTNPTPRLVPHDQA